MYCVTGFSGVFVAWCGGAGSSPGSHYAYWNAQDSGSGFSAFVWVGKLAWLSGARASSKEEGGVEAAPSHPSRRADLAARTPGGSCKDLVWTARWARRGLSEGWRA